MQTINKKILDIFPDSAVEFANNVIADFEIVELDNSSIPDEIKFMGASDGISIYVSREMLKIKNWNLVIQCPGGGRKANCTIIIGRFIGRVVASCVGGKSELLIGNCGHLYANLMLGENSRVIIGDKTTCNGADIMNQGSFTHIGRDCMLSKEILIQASDQHGIFSLENMELSNKTRRSVTILDRVWLGRRATIMPKVTISSGAIIGTGSVVTKDVPPCVAVGGNPAKILREGVSWSRFLEVMDEDGLAFARQRS
jgi:acetyltransferase-like isoleucine patch superfamily enzyme